VHKRTQEPVLKTGQSYGLYFNMHFAMITTSTDSAYCINSGTGYSLYF